MVSNNERTVKQLQRFIRKNLMSYLSKPNITSVGIGLKKDAQGNKTDELQIQFTVDKKLARPEIETLNSQYIEPHFEVEGLGQVTSKIIEKVYKPSITRPEVSIAPSQRKLRQDPVKPGISVSHENGSAGTIGGIVYDNANGTPYLLSNFHVLAESENATCSKIVQPGPYDDSRKLRNHVGAYVNGHIGLAGDCGISSVVGRTVDNRILGLEVVPTKVAEAKLGDKVIKSGRTTGVTCGIVTRVGVTQQINYGGSIGERLIGCFEIEPDEQFEAEDNEISSGGDSGSLWLLRDPEKEKSTNHPVATDIVIGLHFAGESEYNPNEFALSCNIKSVMKKLQVSFQPNCFNRYLIPDSSNSKGYDRHFLGSFYVPLPKLVHEPATKALIVNGSAELTYEHFSVVLHKERKLAIFTAHNVKGYDIKRVPRTKWKFDPRLEESNQHGNELYTRNDWDRGHLVRRVAVNWGTYEEAKQANHDTFYYTNAAPQHKNFNQDEWLALEDWVLDKSRDENKRLCVFTGPVFDKDDQVHRDGKIPEHYWKVIVMEKHDGLSVSAFLMNQIEMADDSDGRRRLNLGLYQVPLTRIESETGLLFEDLDQFQHESFRRVGTSIEVAGGVHNTHRHAISSREDIQL